MNRPFSLLTVVRGLRKIVVAGLEHIKIFAARSRQCCCFSSVIFLESRQVVEDEAASRPYTVIDLSAHKSRCHSISSGIVLETGHEQIH